MIFVKFGAKGIFLCDNVLAFVFEFEFEFEITTSSDPNFALVHMKPDSNLKFLVKGSAPSRMRQDLAWVLGCDIRPISKQGQSHRPTKLLILIFVDVTRSDQVDALFLEKYVAKHV